MIRNTHVPTDCLTCGWRMAALPIILALLTGPTAFGQKVVVPEPSPIPDRSMSVSGGATTASPGPSAIPLRVSAASLGPSDLSSGVSSAPLGVLDSSRCPPPAQWRCGVLCDSSACRNGAASWLAQRPIPWQVFAQGEYVGPARVAHVPEYRLRVDDLVEFVYRLTAKQVSRPYHLEVGDRIKVHFLSANDLDQEVAIQPDGTVTLQFLGQVPAAGRTLDDLRAALNESYATYIKAPNILVVPIKFNSRLEELRASVDARYGTGGQRQQVRVTPEGTVQLPALGSVYVQGLSLNEIKREVDERYAQIIDGVEITPILINRAPRYVFVLGEVRAPGRYTLEGPTTAMQAIAMAGSWNVGASLKQMVVFRRDDCWRLMATKIDLHAALFGKRPCPADEIWLRDSDIVLLPKSPLLTADDFINLLFTRGVYAVVPLNVQLNFSKLSSL